MFFGRIIRVILLANTISCRTGFLREHIEHYSASWLVYVSGDADISKRIAEKEGFQIIKQLQSFLGVYHFKHPKHPERGKYENHRLTQTLLDYPEVLWAKQISYHKHELKFNILQPRTKCPGMAEYGIARYAETLPDVLFRAQWYMQECRADRHYPMYDLGIFPVWYLYRNFGQSIKILFIDDGVETSHPDLIDNYDKTLGLDIIDNDKTPDPKHTLSKMFAHGTKSAGIVSMRAGNKLCGAGIAPLATFGGI